MMARQIEINLHNMEMLASLVIFNRPEDINTPTVTMWLK